MGEAANLKWGWSKAIRPDWTPPRPPGKEMFELKHLNGCASALSQQGVGQALTSLEPQVCHGGDPAGSIGRGRVPIVFWGGRRCQGQAGLTSTGSPRHALILMSD